MKGEHCWRKMFLSLVSFFSVCLLSTAENVRIYHNEFNFVFLKMRRQMAKCTCVDKCSIITLLQAQGYSLEQFLIRNNK